MQIEGIASNLSPSRGHALLAGMVLWFLVPPLAVVLALSGSTLRGGNVVRRWIAVALLIVLAGVGWRVFGSSRRQATPTPQAQPAVPVEVVLVETRTLVATVTAGGNVEAIQEVTVTTMMTGRVAAVLVREGDPVRAGQVLVRLEGGEAAAQVQQAEANVRAAQARLQMLEQGARPQERAQVESAVAQALANYETAKANLSRMQALYETGAISKAQLDAAKLQYDLARAQYDTALQQRSAVLSGPRPEEIDMARAQVAQAQAALTFARLQEANATISAPLSGTVTRRFVDPGDVASLMPGQASLVTIAQIDRVSVVLDVSETDLGKVKIGQPVAVHADAYPDRTFRGTVREIGQAAEARSRVFKVKAVVENRDHALRPGMFARGDITIGRIEHALVIPRDAVVSVDGQTAVFVVKDGKARARNVHLGAMNGPIMEIRSGLAAGESVVIVGQSELSDGTSVTVR